MHDRWLISALHNHRHNLLLCSITTETRDHQKYQMSGKCICSANNRTDGSSLSSRHGRPVRHRCPMRSWCAPWHGERRCHGSEPYARAGWVCDTSPSYRIRRVRTVGSRVGSELRGRGPRLDSSAVADLWAMADSGRRGGAPASFWGHRPSLFSLPISLIPFSHLV
jgi:hypothetical protein